MYVRFLLTCAFRTCSLPSNISRKEESRWTSLINTSSFIRKLPRQPSKSWSGSNGLTGNKLKNVRQISISSLTYSSPLATLFMLPRSSAWSGKITASNWPAIQSYRPCLKKVQAGIGVVHTAPNTFTVTSTLLSSYHKRFFPLRTFIEPMHASSKPCLRDTLNLPAPPA